MKNAFICNSVPSCDIFLHAHAEKSNPTVFCLSGFFFFAVFPFFCCFCLFAAVAICLLGFQSVQEFFQERIIRKFLPSGEEGKLSSKFFTRVSNCTYLKANLSVWVLLFGFSSSRSSFIIIRGALFM